MLEMLDYPRQSLANLVRGDAGGMLGFNETR